MAVMSSTCIPGSVLVGVDGSAGSDAAVSWAAHYAAAHRRPLALVHAAGDIVPTDFAFDLAEARHSLRAAGRQVLDRAHALARATEPSLEISAHLELHDARDLLLSMAEHAAVLVVGSRGRGRVSRLLLGSVSAALVTHAPCPLVVARDPDHEDGPIVVGVDGTPDSSAALGLAFELASEQHRPLEVVHALGDAWLFPAPDVISPAALHDLMEEWDLLLGESLAGYGEKYPDVRVRRRLVQETPAQALVGRSETASTVVVGSRGRSGSPPGCSARSAGRSPSTGAAPSWSCGATGRDRADRAVQRRVSRAARGRGASAGWRCRRRPVRASCR